MTLEDLIHHSILDERTVRPREVHKNVTVYVDEVIDTGEIVLSWRRQPDTEDEFIDPVEPIDGVRIIN